MTALEIRGSRFDPTRPRPLPAPDAWSYDWALRATITLLVGWVLPGGTVVMSRSGNSWAWTEVTADGLSYAAAVWMPLLAGLTCLWAIVSLSGPARSRALCLASAGLAVGWFVLTPLTRYDLFRVKRLNPFLLPRSREGILYDAGFFLSLMSIAVGAHLRRRAPKSLLAVLLCVVGGGALLAWILVPLVLVPGSASPSSDESLPTGWPLYAAGIAYALGSSAFLRVVRPSLFSLAVGILNRAGLLLVLGILFVSAGMKSALLVTGSLICVPLGPAAWLEGRMFRRSRETDPASLANVFR